MMSHNRLVFLTSFAMLALTAVGLDVLWNNQIKRRWWFWLPAVLLAALGGWCVYRSIVLPELITTQAKFDAYRQERLGSIQITTDVKQIQVWFVRHYVIMAGFCLLGFIGWLLVWFQKLSRLFPVLTVLLMGDLFRFDYGRDAQCDPKLYYPEIPALQAVARFASGRVIGINCLPASLAMVQGLDDIRGYDAIDPARMVDLLKMTTKQDMTLPYSATQFLVPTGGISPPNGIRLPPILDMLNVRYAIFRGAVPESIHPIFQSNDYWVLINSNALARVYVPRTVEVATSDEEELAALASPQFQPAVVAYVESPVELPADCRGTVQITNEVPTHIKIAVQMETAGLVVLADNWDKGWRAYWNGKPVPVLRANYAVRGVVLPAGNGTLEFVYRPASLILGLWLAGLAALVLIGWAIMIRIRKL
jgi:hypothetical protein